jgi:hypothetical protein
MYLNDLERCQRANHVICQGKVIILGWGCSKSATCADKKLRATLRLTAVHLISSRVAGAELNRGKSASSDQIGFSFSFAFLFAS